MYRAIFILIIQTDTLISFIADAEQRFSYIHKKHGTPAIT